MRSRGLHVLSAALLVMLASGPLLASRLPQRLSDEAFWQMISQFSEPEGTSLGGDNFVSNETLFQVVLPTLKKSTKPGGVYLGVGPEQNFSYIATLRPGIAFIIDIRRQNLLEHLMYKMLFEASTDRADFVSLLFSRQRPVTLKAGPSASEIFQAYDRVRPDQGLFDENLKMIKERLAGHGFRLSPDDASKIDYVYGTFFKEGPGLNFVARSVLPPELSFPNFEQLMLQPGSFLANEANFRICKDLEAKNLVIPVTGDFAGPRTVRTVGNYVREHGAQIVAIYASNVEEYLFQEQDNWKKYYSNLSTLPLSARSMIVRSVSVTNAGVGYGGPNLHTVMVTDKVSNLLQAFTSGKIAAYLDIIRMSRCGTPDLARLGCRL